MEVSLSILEYLPQFCFFVYKLKLKVLNQQRQRKEHPKKKKLQTEIVLALHHNTHNKYIYKIIYM